MSTWNAPQANVSERLDAMPVTALHIGVMLVCALGFTFDLMEIALGSALSAVFSQPPHRIDSAQLSWLLSAVFLGAIVGAPTLGRLADRFGRRPTLAAMLLWLGAMSLAGAFSTSAAALIVFRVLAGLSLGAYPPTMIAFLTDLLPAARRGMLTFAVLAVSTLGPVGAIFLVRWLTPFEPLGIEAWRWGFIVGASGAMLAAVLYLLLPESPRWLEKTGRKQEAMVAMLRFERSHVVVDRTVPTRALSSAVARAAQPPRMPVPSVQRAWRLVAGVFFLGSWATAAFPLLTGAVLAQKGVNLSDALLYVGLSLFGPTLGSLAAAAFLDRFERRLALIITSGGMLTFGLVFIASSSPFWLVASNLAFSTVGSVYISALNLYSAELFPTEERASRLASAWGMNRVGAALGPLLLLPLMRFAGPFAMFAVVASALLLSIGLLIRAPTGRSQRAVE